MLSVLHISAALSAIMAVFLANLRSEPKLAHRLLAVVFALFATQHLLTSLAVMEIGNPLVWWRPVLAMALAPVIYLHLRSTTQPDETPSARDLIHLTGPAGLALARQIVGSGAYLDVIIILSLVLYCGLCLIHIKAALPAARRWKYMVSGWLILMALADGLVMVELAESDNLRQSRALVFTMAGFLFFLAYLVLTSLNQTGPLSWIVTRIQRGGARSEQVQERLEVHMSQTRPWLDAELTVARLARQLGLPQRTVSETVNDRFGVSVSRWINGWRIAEAQRLMQADPARPLVELMLDCGFQTRSNFNKAFNDVAGETPSAWRKAHCHAPDSKAE
jgi:AraC-like DNA-binding protein